jgi:shikimate kinase
MTQRIYLIGFMGSGKSTVGKRLALRLKYTFVDMDKAIEEEAGIPVRNIFEEKGEDEFRRLEHEMVLKTAEMNYVVVSTGGGVPCFFDNMDIINRNGISIYLQMKSEDLLKRLKGSKYERPLIRDLSTDELEEYIKEKLREREPYYLKSKYIIDGKNPDIKEIVKFVTEEEQ